MTQYRVVWTDPNHPGVCRARFPFTDHLTLDEVEELRRLGEYQSIGGLGLKLSRRYAYLSARRYVPPGIPHPPEAA